MFTQRLTFIIWSIFLGFLVVIACLLWPKLHSMFWKENISLVSPVITKGKTLGVNQWFPRSGLPADRQVLGATSEVPEITAKSAFFVDTKTGQVLFEKNSHDRLPIASLVKVMTTVIAVEHKGLDDKFKISKRVAEVEPDKMYLIPGETLTLRELLYGIFLISANDAAETISEGTTGRREEFIQLMNSKAKQIGMKDTYYANPTGLDEDLGNSYSSAYDLAILARYAVRNYPFLVDFSSTEHMILPQTQDHQDYDMYSGINLLTTYQGVVGFKTGFTPVAGLTLITLARKNGHDLPAARLPAGQGRQEVVGVLLGSQDRRDEARELLDYSFKKLGE